MVQLKLTNWMGGFGPGYIVAKKNVFAWDFMHVCFSLDK